MAKEIKAIETEYNGYRFRSRLEARWALFFDKAGIQYEYELEGFELSEGVRYLPDFYLPEYLIYVEVKPEHAIAFAFDKDAVLKNEKDENKIRKFASEALTAGQSLFVTNGDPYNTLYHWGIVLTKVVCVKLVAEALEIEDVKVENCGDCKNCQEIFNSVMRGVLIPKEVLMNHAESIISEIKSNDYILCVGWEENCALMPIITNCALKPDRFELEDLKNSSFAGFYMAALNARSARFEYGEKG